MYLVQARTLVTEAFRLALQQVNHPILGDDVLWVGQDYPAVRANYPGVWVSYTPNGGVQSAGIGHVELREDNLGRTVMGTRWAFSGTVSATAVALTSLERDAITDELLRLVAFGDEHPDLAALKNYVNDNDLITMDLQWDKATLTAFMESQGTAWGTDDLVYEATVSVSCVGSFISQVPGKAPVGFIEGIEVYPEMDPQAPALPGPTEWQ